MKPKLKEEPREWLKFTAVMALALGILGALLHWRKTIHQQTLAAWIGLLVLTVVLGWIRPRFSRALYRGGMTLSFHFGQIIGKVILTLFFLLVVTPLGLLLRALGKDLLKLKRDPAATTYWQPAKSCSPFDRQF